MTPPRSIRPRRAARAAALLSAVAAAAAVACATQPGQRRVALPSAGLSPADFVTAPQLLAVGDTIGVRFPYRPAEVSQEIVVVRGDGRVTLPYAGEIIAAGRTPADLESELRRRYDSVAYEPSRDRRRREYRINASDQLDIRFRTADRFNSAVTVRPDGKISLPLVKTVVAEGKTPEDLEHELIEQYGRYLESSDLVVVVTKFTSDRVYVDGRPSRSGTRDLDEATVIVRGSVPRQVFVAGEVVTPGFLRYQTPMTALEAIVGAGGVRNTASLDRVLVLRRVGVDTATATFLNLRQDVRGAALNDLPLRPFDIVIVPKTRIATVNQFLDQYLYQLIPATRNVNFSFFYDLKGRSHP